MNDIEKLVAARRRAVKHLAEIDAALATARENQKKAAMSKAARAPRIQPLIRFPELLRLLGYKSHESIYNLTRRDPSFPRPRNLGGVSVAWVRSEVEEWIATRPAPDWAVWNTPARNDTPTT